MRSQCTRLGAFPLVLVSVSLLVACNGLPGDVDAPDVPDRVPGTGHDSTAHPDAVERTVTVPGIPQDLDEFRQWRDEVATTPEGGYAAYIVAMQMHAEDEDLGMAALVMQTRRDNLVEVGEERGYYQGYTIRAFRQPYREQLRGQPWIPAAYLGGLPSEGYALEFPAELRMFIDPQDREDRAKVFARTATAGQTPQGRYIDRIAHLERNSRGIWKVYRWSDIYVDQPPPAGEEEVDDF